MRTTLTIEPDVAQRLTRVRKRRKGSLKRVINDALRAGLKNLEAEEQAPPKFIVKPFDIDPLGNRTVSEVLDEMDYEEFLKKDRKLRKQLAPR